MIQVAAHFPLSPTSPRPLPAPPLSHTHTQAPTHTHLSPKHHETHPGTLVTEINTHLRPLSSRPTASALPAASLSLTSSPPLSLPQHHQALTQALNQARGNAKHLLPLRSAYGIGNRKKKCSLLASAWPHHSAALLITT